MPNPSKDSVVRPVFAGASQNLKVTDLAERWDCAPDTVLSNYRKWGLRPMRFGRCLLFPLGQVIAAEKRQQGEIDAAE